MTDHLKISIHVPNGWTMPSMVAVVRILAISYNVIGSTTAILAQIKVCMAAIMGRWRQVRDMETPPTPRNPLYVSLNDGWRPLIGGIYGTYSGAWSVTKKFGHQKPPSFFDGRLADRTHLHCPIRLLLLNAIPTGRQIRSITCAHRRPTVSITP